MFNSKKSKIAAYLDIKQEQKQMSVFDTLLSDYLSGFLKNKLIQLSLKKIEIHIDWLTDYKCIDIQGKYGDFFVDIQIEPLNFTIACDKEEPDDPVEFELESVEYFYSTIEHTLCGI